MLELKGKRILVTGAAGFIGANLLHRLADGASQIHAILRPGGRAWRIASLSGRITVHQVDLTDLAQVEAVVQAVRPQVIFHLAVAGVRPSQRNGWDIVQPNLTGTANLLEALEKLDYERLVHMGGASEYGAKDQPIRETDLPEPTTLYGASKAAATLLCQHLARSKGRPIAILRPFSVYGYWEAGHRLVPTAILAALRGSEMALTQDVYRRDFVFVEDVVEACVLAATTGNADGQILNIGSGREWSSQEVVQLVEAATGRKIRISQQRFPARPSDTAHWVACNDKAKSLLGWEPKHTLPEGLARTAAWFRQHIGEYGVE